MKAWSVDPEADRRGHVAQGIAWNTLYQIFQTVLSFGAMLVLVRVIPPSEYGRGSAVLGFLTLLNTFNCGVFMAQALQLPDGVEPDWSLHWSVGLQLQIALTALCNLIAAICWLFLSYRPVAPLLHLASLGLLLDVAARLRLTMLRRALNFRRLRILSSIAATMSAAVTICLACMGGGAYALVLGANVVIGLPFGIDLVFVRRWRPQSGWWQWPDWPAYRPALHFGLQRVGSGLLRSARGTLEAVVLPGALGFPAMGLLSRAQALFTTTAGRVGSVLIETAYPLLPRYAADSHYYPRQATLFAQVILLIVIPGGLYLGLEGPAVSRLLYGEKWRAVDPLLWPGALLGLGMSIHLVSSNILLAVNRLRTCFALNLLGATLGAPMVIVAWAGGGLIAYSWALAAGQLLAATITLVVASSFFTRGWIWIVLVPPVTSSALAAGVLMMVDSSLGGMSTVVRLCLSGSLYVLIMLVAMRSFFPTACTAVLSRAPWGARLQGWLGLSRASVEFS
jgi:O-antigen/teichoic acid export membrane protein